MLVLGFEQSVPGGLAPSLSASVIFRLSPSLAQPAPLVRRGVCEDEWRLLFFPLLLSHSSHAWVGEEWKGADAARARGLKRLGAKSNLPLAG